ncbi:hypothetical protein [Chitinolyticbacter meiyuanensis]|uniref:hypothetical protein n=1 Tax=Chitinolyticbacter meiyuanensis TaxID=682798 RepID=UPI001C9E8476|nr:hypothetical protein [Chitinolyticbacter meiyuanensis]
MSTAVLLSIKPEFANAIFSGDKTFEFRKAVFKDKTVKKIYVYASAPISKVIGTFDVDEIIERAPATLWEETNLGAGITEDYFWEYFAGRNLGYAIRVEKTQLFEEPQELHAMFGIRHPPQSFRYVPHNEYG